MQTLIKNGTVIAWTEQGHQIIHGGAVAFDEQRIIHVGESYDGYVDQVIDAQNHIVMPGFVNAHLHLTDTPFTKGYLEDNVSRNSDTSGEYTANLYRTLPAVRNATDPDAQLAGAECALAELLRCGSTTIVEMAYDYEIMGGDDIEPVERVARAIGEAGIRAYSAPRYRTYYYREHDDGEIRYKNNPSDGRDRFEACKSFCRRWDGQYGGRLRTMLAPGQVDTCEPDLLLDTRQAANEMGLPIQIHAGQSAHEYRRIKQTYDQTSIEYMSSAGLLGPDFIIGHGQHLSESGDVDQIATHDLELLRESQTTIAHLPWVKARRGGVINSISKYARHGVRQCLGTDTYPFDMFLEMRTAAMMCKTVEQSAAVALAPDVFHMATIGGAEALGRTDLGRLAVGCRPDIVLVRTDTPKASPVFDPFKFLVFTATGDDVDKVIIDGHLVVDEGKVRTMDVPAIVDRVNEAGERVRTRIGREKP